MNLYIAGPMRNYPGLNHEAFNEGTKNLRALGHEVFNPAEHDQAIGIGPDDAAKADAAIRQLLGADLAWITSTADGVVVLPGWERSMGARAETATAWAIGIPVWELAPFLRVGGKAMQVRAGAA